jgi:hypothetical protein
MRKSIPSHGHRGSTLVPMKFMIEAALVAASVTGATPAGTQSFQDLVKTFYDNEFRTHPMMSRSMT